MIADRIRRGYARIMLGVALVGIATTVVIAIGQVHHGGGWSTARCVSAQDQGGSRDLLIEHGCQLNIFDGSVVQDQEGSGSEPVTTTMNDQCIVWWERIRDNAATVHPDTEAEQAYAEHGCHV